jgi:hypothetical protein
MGADPHRARFGRRSQTFFTIFRSLPRPPVPRGCSCAAGLISVWHLPSVRVSRLLQAGAWRSKDRIVNRGTMQLPMVWRRRRILNIETVVTPSLSSSIWFRRLRLFQRLINTSVTTPIGAFCAWARYGPLLFLLTQWPARPMILPTEFAVLLLPVARTASTYFSGCRFQWLCFLDVD